MSKSIHLFATLSLLTAFSVTLVGPALAETTTLKGNVNQSDFLKPKNGPSLNRNDIKNAGDPFGNDGPTDQGLQSDFEPPAEAFQVQNARPAAPPQRNFGLQAEDEGGDFQGTPMQAQQSPQQMGNPMQGQLQQQQQQGRNMGNPNDPDNAPDMQLAWDMWHKRVAEAVYMRFNSLATMAFKRSKPLACMVSYTVTRDGRIINAKILQGSDSMMFNTMLVGVINSLNGNPILQFPPGSRRQMVEKGGTFQHNFGQGQGYKYTTGDRETLRQQQMQGRQQGR